MLVPSSAMIRPYGIRKKIERKASQKSVCVPKLAAAPSVSMPTSAQMLKSARSHRKSDFLSLRFSSTISVVAAPGRTAVDATASLLACCLLREPVRNLNLAPSRVKGGGAVVERGYTPADAG